LAAELIAGAFASGISWGGKLGGKEVFRPPGLTGRRIMGAFVQFIADAQDMADKPCGVALAPPNAEGGYCPSANSVAGCTDTPEQLDQRLADLSKILTNPILHEEN
jgi:hypothetical protein